MHAIPIKTTEARNLAIEATVGKTVDKTVGKTVDKTVGGNGIEGTAVATEATTTLPAISSSVHLKGK